MAATPKELDPDFSTWFLISGPLHQFLSSNYGGPPPASGTRHPRFFPEAIEFADALRDTHYVSARVCPDLSTPPMGGTYTYMQHSPPLFSPTHFISLQGGAAYSTPVTIDSPAPRRHRYDDPKSGRRSPNLHQRRCCPLRMQITNERSWDTPPSTHP